MIRLGYQLGSGKPVDIPDDRHIAISGQTQRSGKTTTLEALVRRSGKRAVAFVTKRAEAGFRDARIIAPYFRDSADWQFVSSILEAMLGERMKFERSWIIDACRGAKRLADVLANVKRNLHGEANPAYQEWYRSKKKKRRKAPNEWLKRPAQGLNAGVLTQLEAYLDIVIPQIERLPYTRSLDLTAGLQVMDPSEYSTELQALVIRSVLEWVYLYERETVVIVPEAWEFIPQNRRSPVLLAAEELIRKGAAANNFIWLDSQDIASVHKNVLRSVTVWVIGKQMELNELGRAADYLRAARVREEEIAFLGRGQFYVACDNRVEKVYVQPFWITDAHAAAIARGEEAVESAEKIWREEKKRHRATEHTESQDSAEESPGHPPLQSGGGDAGEQGKAAAADGCSSPEPPLYECGTCGGPLRADGHCENRDTTRDDEKGAESQSTEDTASQPCMRSSAVQPDAESAALLSGLEDEMTELQMGDLMRKLTKLENENAKLHRHIGPHPAVKECAEICCINAPLGAGALTGELAHRQAFPANEAGRPVFSENGNFSAFLRQIREHPEVIALIAQRPEIRLTLERPKLDWSANSLQGRLALLVSQGFFASPKGHGAILAECKRRQWVDQKSKGGAILYNPLEKLAEMGFLTVESEGYQAVSGMKLTVHEK